MATYKLRIIINSEDVRKISLERKPHSVEELKQIVKEKCQVEEDFSLMFEDPDFNNALCNLDNIGDLPDEKATVKVIHFVTLTLFPTSSTSISNESVLSDDADILSTHSSSSTSRPEKWPEFFDVPNFAVDVEFRLRQANLRYMKDQTYFHVPRDMKHSILEKLAEAMYKYDAYPNVERCHSVASALITKHPCLTEPGSPDGCSGWKNSLVYKMGNFRHKLKKSGCFEVAVNSKKAFPEMASKTLKRPKRFEVNYLPDLPQGQTQEKLEAERVLLTEEMKKRNPIVTLITTKMNQTFPLRCREIVETGPPVKTVKERWPVLFTEKQVYAEFNRIATTNLESDFFDSLDCYTPRFAAIFKTKTGNVGEKLAQTVQQIDACTHDVIKICTLVLQGLSILLGDDTNFYNTSFDQGNDETWAQVTVGILTVLNRDAPPNQEQHDMVSTSIILEGGIVMDNLQNIPQALCILFGLMYALHLDYPKAMKHTFNFIQRVMLGLGANKLAPKLQTLKNLLLL